MIGYLISWIPFIGGLGGIVVIIGAILVIIGREAFGHAHARNVIVAIIVWIVGIAILIATIIAIFIAAFTSAITNPGSRIAVPLEYTVILLIAAAIEGIASVLLTYELQNNIGRALLWTAYVLGIVLGIVNGFLIVPQFAGTRGLFQVSGAFVITGLLAAPSAIMYGVAFYMARERIERKEIPTPEQPPSPTSSGTFH